MAANVMASKDREVNLILIRVGKLNVRGTHIQPTGMVTIEITTYEEERVWMSG